VKTGMMPKLSAFADESSEVFAEQLHALKRNHIHYMEIRSVEGKAIHTCSLAEVSLLKEQANHAGVGFSAVGSALGKCDIDVDMHEQFEMCKHLIEIANLLETPHIRMFSFHVPQESNPEEYRQKVIDTIGIFTDIVAGTGFCLVHENENKIYGETAARCVALCQAFEDTGVFKSVFDFANFVQAGQDPLADCWPLLKKYTAYFHIKDACMADRRVVPAGQGDGRIREILSDAYANGFDSFLTLEPHLWPRYFPGKSSSARFDIGANALQELLKDIANG
jgi:sugar phosphate isomerase/epimerase